MRVNSRVYLSLVVLVLAIFQTSCQKPKPSTKRNLKIETVTIYELSNNTSKHATQFVDIRGEISSNPLGSKICDETGCIRIVLPENIDSKQNYDLVRDSQYLEYQKFCLANDTPQKKRSRLIGTLRGKYHLFTSRLSLSEKDWSYINQDEYLQIREMSAFVLQKVMELKFEELKPTKRPDPIHLKPTVCKVHGVAMLQDNVKIAYGLVKFPTGHYEAQKQYFPNSNRAFYAGCVRGPEEWKTVLYCPKCRLAENEWLNKKPPSNQIPH
jgi:hypothetical protein